MTVDAKKLKLDSALVFSYEQYKLELRLLGTGKWTWRVGEPGVTGWIYCDDFLDALAWIGEQQKG